MIWYAVEVGRGSENSKTAIFSKRWFTQVIVITIAIFILRKL